MDLRPLQRVDGATTAVLAKAKHTALYKLHRLADGSEEWERMDTEGALYVVRRDAQPRYGLCVLNRLSTTDFFETISLPHCEFDYTDRFILFRKRGEVRAIWVSTERDDEGADGLELCRRAIDSAMRELQATPQEPMFVSRGSSGDGAPMSKDELRDALFRLLNNDKVLDSLHAQFLATEARRSAVASPSAAIPLHAPHAMHAMHAMHAGPRPGMYPRMPPPSPFGPGASPSYHPPPVLQQPRPHAQW